MSPVVSLSDRILAARAMYTREALALAQQAMKEQK